MATDSIEMMTAFNNEVSNYIIAITNVYHNTSHQEHQSLVYCPLMEGFMDVVLVS